MASVKLTLPGTADDSSRFAWSGLARPVEALETICGPESGVVLELRRERARIKLLLELTRQIVSHQELGDVLRAVMVSIRNGVQCDGVCVFLGPPQGGELQVHGLDFPDDADFQQGDTISLAGTIAAHVVQTAKAWSGSREEECTHFPRRLLLAPGFSTGCML